MKKTAIIYSFNSHKTAKAAEKIMDAFGKEKIRAVNAEEITEGDFLNYDNLILGVPTWFDGELPNYWDELVPALKDLDMKGKTVAIFGLGDQVGYPENFADGIGVMGNLFRERGAKLVGFTDNDQYQFESSRAIENGKFMGLVLDQENQARLSKGRIEKWVTALKKELDIG
ncbi:MAG: flavodoxin [Mangrovibacterium sp.]|nr:flavodoxin [Mangrovibacterium sp.]